MRELTPEESDMTAYGHSNKQVISINNRANKVASGTRSSGTEMSLTDALAKYCKSKISNNSMKTIIAEEEFNKDIK